MDSTAPRDTPPPKLDFSPTASTSPDPLLRFPVPLSGRAAPTQRNSSEATSGREDSSPEGPLSPPSAVPQALHFSPEERDSTFAKSVSAEVALGAAQPAGDAAASEALLVDLRLDQLAVTPQAESTAPLDVPLIDFCNTPEARVPLGSERGPLIDLLLNTPDMDRNTAAKAPQEVGQVRSGRGLCRGVASGGLHPGSVPRPKVLHSDP